MVLLPACTVWEYELGAPLAASNLTADKGTELAVVLDRLGPPLRLSAVAGGFVLAWEYWQVREASLGVSLGAAGAKFLSLDWGDAKIKGEFLLLTFDATHRLSAHSFSRWDTRIGGGTAVQPLIGLATLTDVDDLVGPMPQHEWGGAWLLRLPESLNTPSRPDMGQTGLQQRGTPRGIGQQSLEMNN
jgi:hypothetical protein